MFIQLFNYCVRLNMYPFRAIYILLMLGLPLLASSQNTKEPLSRPKMVVGIVIDQMRYDYLYRFYDKYGEDGFKRMLREGFNCRNHHYHYGNTSTGAGHASVYTGSAPALHGILGNDWYVSETDTRTNCVEDHAVTPVGSQDMKAGQRSPKNLMVTTITDQLRIATNFRSKTVSIALKDRASILPGGHSANHAYWYDGVSGNWMTSTYYRSVLPGWVKDFNALKLPEKYLSQGWHTLYPISTYRESSGDDQPYEEKLPDNDRAVFPHKLTPATGFDYDRIGSTHWGNTLTKEMAIAAVKGENLGKGGFTDFLALSFSAPDGVGHRFGPNSIEQQDLYLRLDRELADLFQFLDNWTGKGEYTVFLTADHGVMDVPEFLVENKIPAQRYNTNSVYQHIKDVVSAEFGDENFIKAISLRQIYLDKQKMRQKGVTIDQIQEVIREKMVRFPEISDVLNLGKLRSESITDYQKTLYLNEYNRKRSGDLLIVFQPGWIGRPRVGTTHGSPYNYDTHVPFVLFGWGITQGETLSRTHISDIAPTISALLRILPPSGSIGDVVEQALKKNTKP
jgi:predicted AlkP superfamily pyrophosphatase or phosphodiesterase